MCLRGASCGVTVMCVRVWKSGRSKWRGSGKSPQRRLESARARERERERELKRERERETRTIETNTVLQ
jgi:hypothetical protein